MEKPNEADLLGRTALSHAHKKELMDIVQMLKKATNGKESLSSDHSSHAHWFLRKPSCPSTTHVVHLKKFLHGSARCLFYCNNFLQFQSIMQNLTKLFLARNKGCAISADLSQLTSLRRQKGVLAPRYFFRQLEGLQISNPHGSHKQL